MTKKNERPIRVLHVLSGDLWAGAEVMAATLLRNQVDDPTMSVHAVVLNHGRLADELIRDGATVVLYDEKSLGGARLLSKIRNRIRDVRPDVVHTHRLKENVLGSIGSIGSGARCLRTVHGWSEFPDLGLRIDKHLTRWLDRATGRWLQDRVVAVSEPLGKLLETVYPKDSVEIIENGVDIAVVRRAAKSPAMLPGRAGRRKVGIVARLVPVKRHDRFLEAARQLLDDGDDIDFYVAGSGEKSTEIESWIGNHGLAGNVHMLGHRDDVLAMTAALDALVICSDHEGLPMNALEAAVLGVPIVTVPLPSIRSILDSGAAGLTCDGAEAHQLVDGIRRALANGAATGSLGANWRYSSTTMTERYRRLYEALISSRAA